MALLEHVTSATIVAGIVVLVGCSPSERAAQTGSPAPPPAFLSPPATASPAAKQYDIRGRVEAVSADRATVTLDHEAIPGLMAAMKMEYKVADPQVLKGLKAGDRVQGRLEAQDGDYVILTLSRP